MNLFQDLQPNISNRDQGEGQVTEQEENVEMENTEAGYVDEDKEQRCYDIGS